MSTKWRTFAGILMVGLLLAAAGTAGAAELETVRKVAGKTGSEFIKGFSEALYKRNHATMSSMVARNRETVLPEANAFCDAALAPGVSVTDQEAMFYVLERLATVYRDVTGDKALLAALKKRMFESRLSAPTASKTSEGLYVVEHAAGAGHTGLVPNNIIIRSGETVRWVNNDTATQRLASVMSPAGRKEILSPAIEPGKGWEHTFYTPGEYYYITFPNKVLYGKVVVKE